MPISAHVCPECGLPVEIVHSQVFVSTHGPVEHVHVRCPQRHWFLLAADLLEVVAEPPPRTRRHPVGRARGPGNGAPR
jgi:hypothetical protein